MSTLHDGAKDRATAPGLRAVRRALGVLSLALAMALIGSGTAWAWWTDVRSVTATATVFDIRPGKPTCTPKADADWDFQESPATFTWAPPALRPGATVSYSVTTVSDNQVKRSFPTSATSIQLAPGNFGSSSTDQRRLQTVTVSAIVTFPGNVVWTSVPSDSVKTRAVPGNMGVLNMTCPA